MSRHLSNKNRREIKARNQSASAHASMVAAFNDMEARTEKQRLNEQIQESRFVPIEGGPSVAREFLFKAPLFDKEHGVEAGSYAEICHRNDLVKRGEPVYTNRDSGVTLYF